MNKKMGFTLIEVVLAMMIMVTGLMILTSSWASTYTRLHKTQVQVQLAALLERKVVEIEKEYKNKPIDTIPEEKEDTFGSDLPEYSWKMKSQKLELPDISPLVGGGGGEGSSGVGGTNLDLTSIMKMFTEHLNKSIREIKIEVIYADKKKPISADIVIYMIDYDRPLSMGGGG